MKHITGNWTYTIGGIPSCPICGKRDKIIGIDGAYECGRCDISPTKYVANMQARIAELERPILCAKCNDHIIADDGAVCEICADTMDTIITELQTRNAELEAMHDHQHLLDLADEAVAAKCRIAELEKLAVVWNKYPAEKPPESGIEYLVLIDGEIPRLAVYGHHVLYEDDTMNKWYSDEGPAKEPVPYGETEITHWAYLPAPPEEK